MSVYFARSNTWLLLFVYVLGAVSVPLNLISTPVQQTVKLNLEDDCGLRPYMQDDSKSQIGKRLVKRIVGGSSSLKGEWPWHVMVKESKLFGVITDYKCGGALISRSFVLTAAHCQPNSILSRLVVVLGQYSLDEENLPVIPVRRMTIHKKFNESVLHNDIALLQLDTPADFSDRIMPICLPKSTDSFAGMAGVVSGWGRLYFNGELPKKLQSVNLPIIAHEQCKKKLLSLSFLHVKQVPESFLCAGYNEGEFDSCEGDSGGPLAVHSASGRWVLAGTVSHGLRCAEPGVPGIYMQTSFYRPWIDQVIEATAKSSSSSSQSWLLYLWDLMKSIPNRISIDITHF